MQHQTKIYIHLRAFENNLRTLLSRFQGQCRVCAVVKADAYGHGIRLLAPVAASLGVDYLGIADNWEASTIRELGISCPILRLRPALMDEMIEARQWQVEEVIGNRDSALDYSRFARTNNQTVPVHLKVDVGIGRMGFSYPRQKNEIWEALSLPGLRFRGIMTHFPCADEENETVTLSQLNHFQETASDLRERLPEDALRHAANSAAALRFPNASQSMIRLGIVMYGLQPGATYDLPSDLLPVMSWHTRVVQVRSVSEGSTIGYGMTHRSSTDARIATLPIGYADAYPLALSNQGHVLIRGRRCPIVGRISMDMVTIDVSHLPSAAAGDEVVILGNQGSERITAEEIAAWAGTINYVIPCLAGKCNYVRVPDSVPLV